MNKGDKLYKLPTYDAARGRWREILPQLGVSVECLNGKNQPCPACGGTDRFQFTDRHGDGDYVCRGCGAGKGPTLVAKVNGWGFGVTHRTINELIGNLSVTGSGLKERESKNRSRKEANRDELRKLWLASREIVKGDPVTRYFDCRGIHIDTSLLRRCLRYVPKLHHYPSKTVHPGFIAVFSTPDGKAQTIQRTFLGENGDRASVEPSRMFVKGALAKGGAIRLFPADKRMGVAEGIETALAASELFAIPVWATTGWNMLQSWQPPHDVSEIVVFSDNDENFAGQSAANHLAERLSSGGISVDVKIPREVGQDWNDVLLANREKMQAA